MIRPISKFSLAGIALAVAICAAYANHFHNAFHFDDSHSIVMNGNIRDVRNIPEAFRDARISSALATNQGYRPLVFASLAIDYRLGGKLDPLWFHISTFFWFSVLLCLMFLLFRRVLDVAGSSASHWTALAATACFGLHPAVAETVNYIIQRADIYSTLGVVASVVIFAIFPARRGSCLYLLPAVAGCLSKPPAMVFPVLLFAYAVLIERNSLREALRATWPSWAASGAIVVFISRMTPPTFDPGATSAWLYRLTQPWIALQYFGSFFLPTRLTADTDLGYVSGPWSTEAVAGFVFVVLLARAAWSLSQIPAGRPIAFGIVWFFVALAPTSLMPLAEVANDHRMFFPFVGLTLAVCQAANLAVAPKWRPTAAAIAVTVLIVFAAGTHERNNVWRTEESLWRDVTIKSPRNGRGWMNYGLALMQRGDYAAALANFNRALALTPNYWTLEINLGFAYAGLNQPDLAEQHFLRSVALAPGLADPRYYYARWLDGAGRNAEARRVIAEALRISPDLAFVRELAAAIEKKAS